MPINTVIIEDEAKSLSVLHEYIRLLAPDLKVCGTASHSGTAMQLISAKSPQLVFLGIRMEDGLGFEVLRNLPSRNFELICISAYDKYAWEAFRYEAVDYLLEPIGMQDFSDAMGRVRKRLVEKIHYDTIESMLYNFSQRPEHDKKISVPTLAGYDFINLQEIMWCKSKGSYTTFHLNNKSTITSSRNLGEFEDMLCHNNFVRIHNSVIINMHWVKRYI